MERTLAAAVLAALIAAAPAARAATAAELKLDWRMTASQPAVSATASGASSAGIAVWLRAVSWSIWTSLSTSKPATVMTFR